MDEVPGIPCSQKVESIMEQNMLPATRAMIKALQELDFKLQNIGESNIDNVNLYVTHKDQIEASVSVRIKAFVPIVK